MRPDPWRLVTALAVAVTFALASGAAAPPPARADVCNDIPSIPGVPNPVKTGCKVAGSIPGAVSDPGKAVTSIVTAPFNAAGDAVMQGVTKWVADGAGWLVGQAGKLIDATTTPRLDSPWFGQQYRAMAALAAVFALPLLLLSVLQSVMRRDSSIVVRAAFVHLPAAFLLTAGAVAVVVMFLQLTDEMCTQVSSSVGSDAGSFFKNTTDALGKLAAATGGQGAVPLFAVFLGGLIAAVGAFFVWIELVIRSAAVYVTVLFLPFTFVAMVWPSTARWCRRLVELLFAVVFSKFVIVAIMALAAAGLGQSRSGDAFQGVIAGAALMLLAALSPMVLLRLIPLAEAAAHSNWRSGAGSQTLGPIAGPAATMRRVADANWGGMGGGGLRAAPAAAGAGPAGLATAGAAGAMTGAVRARSDHADAGASGGDGVRYAAAGGGGQAARPSAPSSGQTGAPAGASVAPATPATSAASAPRMPAQRDGRNSASGGPRPMAAARDRSGNSRPPATGGDSDGGRRGS